MAPEEIYQATLERLNVVAPADPTDPSDVAKVTEKYTSLHAMLLKLKLITWSVTEDVPTEAEQPVIAMLAALSAREFSVPEPHYGALIVEGGLSLPQASLAERQLRKVITQDYVPYPVVSEYF